MNALSLFNPNFAADVFDRIDNDLSLFAPIQARYVTNSLVDVKETNENYVMDMELPGLNENDIELNLKDRVLTISSVKQAETKEESKVEDGTWLIKERRSLSFNRRFTLPEDIEAQSVEATFKNGVLTVVIPKRAETQPRQISIKAN